MQIQYEIILLGVLILLSGVFSGVETAFFSLERFRVRHLVKKKVIGAQTVSNLKKNQQRLLVTILIGNNVANIAASALATSIAIRFSASNAVGITTGVMTFLILVFGEITPKSVAARFNEKVALMAAKPLALFQTSILPIVIIFETLTKLMTRFLKKKTKPLVTEDEIKTIVSMGEEIGQIEDDEKDMINRVFRFNDLDAEDIMTPREEIQGVSFDRAIRDIVPEFHKYGHSRLIVYKGNFGTIIGFIHLLDFQKAMTEKRHNLKVEKIARPIYFVSEHKKLDSLFRYLQRKKSHMAVVVNDEEENLGIVTMKDVVRQIVGTYTDESEFKK